MSPATVPTAPPRVRVVGTGAPAAALTRLLAAGADPAAPAVVVVPRVPAPGALAGLTDAALDAQVADPLTEVVDAVQQALPALRASGDGRLVFVLPVGPVMGEPSLAAAAAVAGGVLSMARTFALELGRDGIVVATLVVDPGRFGDLGPGVAAQLAALLGPGGAALTGQEIYAAGGVEVGRLRP